MNKRINIAYLYFILPLLFFLYINFSRETDIWFIFSHGRYIINNGFPYTEFLTIHSGLHFIMQQWCFSLIMYILYHYLGSNGVIIFTGIINLLIIYFLYKLCLKISNNTYFSILTTSLIDLVLELTFITPRPQIITYLFLIITIYLLERKDNKIYFLLLISLLQINIHASMWLMIIILSLPYIVEYIIKKDKYLNKLLIVLLISFLLGFINPYGIEAMIYPFFSYGIPTINKIVVEMSKISFVGDSAVVYNSYLFIIGFFIFLITIIFNNKDYSIHIFLLFIGLSILAFLNIRNIALFFIGVIPFITKPLKKELREKISIIPILVIITVIITIFITKIANQNYKLTDNNMYKIGEYFKNKNSSNLKIFCYYENGPYLEYHNYRAYIDSRAEVFIKKFNKKEDILDEYYKVLKGKINYQNFIDKYHFTHIIVKENDNFYKFLTDNNYKYVYKYKNYRVFINTK